MIYQCDVCRAPLPAGMTACPKCGERFLEAVPADAEVPKRGFTAVEPAPSTPSPAVFQPPEIFDAPDAVQFQFVPAQAARPAAVTVRPAPEPLELIADPIKPVIETLLPQAAPVEEILFVEVTSIPAASVKEPLVQEPPEQESPEEHLHSSPLDDASPEIVASPPLPKKRGLGRIVLVIGMAGLILLLLLIYSILHASRGSQFGGKSAASANTVSASTPTASVPPASVPPASVPPASVPPASVPPTNAPPANAAEVNTFAIAPPPSPAAPQVATPNPEAAEVPPPVSHRPLKLGRVKKNVLPAQRRRSARVGELRKRSVLQATSQQAAPRRPGTPLKRHSPKPMPLRTRKMLYAQYWRAWDRAQTNTSTTYLMAAPRSMTAYDLHEHQMEQKSLARFRRKFHLSEKQQNLLREQGINSDWPHP